MIEKTRGPKTLKFNLKMLGCSLTFILQSNQNHLFQCVGGTTNKKQLRETYGSVINCLMADIHHDIP